MKKLLFLLLFISKFVLCQNLTKEELKQDLDTFRIKLPLEHKNFYAKISKKDFENRTRRLERKLDRLSQEEFEVELAKIIKQVRDEHTLLIPSFENRFPLDFEFFKEGIYYTKKSDNNFVYGKVEKIGNVPIDKVLRKFKTIIQSENEFYFKSIFLPFVTIPNYLKGLKINNNSDRVDLKFDHKNILLKSVPKKQFLPIHNSNLLRFSKNDNYWFNYLKDKNLLYINYSKCSEIKDYPFSEFTEDVFKTIESENVKKIVIDFRDNGGGNSAIIKPFLEKLKSSRLNNKNSLFVLIGYKTFSSGLINAITLKKDFNSTLIGETTSGNINHYGEVSRIQLPNTNAIVQFSTKYWENWKGKTGPLKPDVPIEYSYFNYEKGIDEALEYIFKH